MCVTKLRKATDWQQELMVSLPCAEDSKIRIDQSDPTTRSKLAEIKLACEVWIEVDDDFVTILGRNKDKLKAALTELQTFIKRINKEIEGRMISLVEHSIATSRLPVEIKSITSDGAPYRPVTTTVHSEKIKCPAKDEKSTGGYQGLADELGEAIREAAKRIRPVEGELRVRMHMGLFSLQMRRANQDTFYDDEGFRKYLKKTSDKGWAYVGHRYVNLLSSPCIILLGISIGLATRHWLRDSLMSSTRLRTSVILTPASLWVRVPQSSPSATSSHVTAWSCLPKASGLRWISSTSLGIIKRRRSRASGVSIVPVETKSSRSQFLAPIGKYDRIYYCL